MNKDLTEQTFTLHARIVDSSTSEGIAGLAVEGWIRGLSHDEFVAAATTDPDGYFGFEVPQATLAQVVGAGPAALSFRIFSEQRLLLDTATTLQWRVREPVTSLCIPVDRSAPPGTERPAFWSVRGRLTDANGRALPGKRISAKDRNVGLPEKVLGEGTTDSQGRYRIAYDVDQLGRAQKRRPDLVIRAVDNATGKELASRFVCQAPPRAAVDLSATEVTQVVSEFEQVVAAVDPLRGGVLPGDLSESDVDLIACSAGIDRERVRLFALAHRMAEGNRVSPAGYYGLLRWGLPEEWSRLVLAGRGGHRRALTWAVKESVIAALSGVAIDEVVDELAELAAGVALEVRTPGAGTVGDLLATALPDAGDQQRFLRRYVMHEGRISALWSALGDGQEFSEGQISKLQRAFQLGALVRHHLPLFKRLEADLEASTFQSLRELAKLDEGDWIALLKDDTKGPPIGAPAGVPGATEDERLGNYASVLAQSLEVAFPGAAIAGRLGAAPPVLSDALEILSRTPELELGQVRIADYLEAHPEILTGVGSPTVTVAQLKGFERLHKLTHATAEISALVEKGLDSAQSVVRLGRARLRQLLGSELTPGRIDAIFSAARQVTASSHAIAARYHAAFNTVPAHVLPTPAPPSAGQVASWPSLFGSLDFCACGHCRSVYGPAAYLVDLLQFLHRQLVEQQSAATWTHFSIFTQQNVQFTASQSARDVLLVRRPDLASIELTCKNTDTPLPYVDLVNEILEYAVANTALTPAVAFPEHIATEGTAAQLASQPQPLAPAKQVVQDKAYQLLAESPYPWRLPFNMGLEEARIYLDHLGVPRARLMEVLDRSEEGRPITPPSWALTLERLRLSEAEAQLLTGTSPMPWWTHWGLLETGNALEDPTGASASPIQGTWVAVLKHVAILMQRSGLSYDALSAVLATDFVDPLPKALTIEAAPGADPLTCKLAELRIPALDAVALDRLHRFTRLQRALGWTVAEVDQALSTFGGSMDAQLLVHLADVVRLREEVQVPVLELLSWWGRIQTRTPIPEERPLYEGLFLNKAVTNPVDAAFGLNSEATDLAAPVGLAEHTPALLSALQCSQAELDLLTRSDVAAALHLSPLVATTQLGLDDLSRLFRAVSIARALNLPLTDLLVLREFSHLDVLQASTPWQTRRFVAAVREVAASRVGVAQLDEFLRHGTPAATGTASPLAAVDLFLDDLEARLEQLQKDLVPSSDEPSPLPRARALVLERLGGALKVDMATAEYLSVKVLRAPASSTRPVLSMFLHGLDGETVPSRAEARLAFLRLEKVASLVTPWKISLEELRWMVAPEQGTPLLPLDGLPGAYTPASETLFRAWLTLARLVRLRDTLPAGKGALADLFRMEAALSQGEGGPGAGGSAAQSPELIAAIATCTGWSLPDVASLSARFADLTLGERLLRMETACGGLRRLGVTAETAVGWVDAETTLEAARATALEVRNAVKAKYDEARWDTLARPLRDVLRERQRDALVGYLLWKHGYADQSRLFAELLVDVEMSPCQLTSRIGQAISSVQTFVQRCFLNLEAHVTLDEEAAREWTWMRNYRVWEANRKVFLCPENWIEPELRDDKTPFFEALDNELLQSDLDEVSAEKAFSAYLVKLDQVARLKVTGMVRQREGSGKNALDVLHVFARTPSTPHVHFYRRRAGDETWSPWEKIELDIQSNHLIPVVYERRLLLFWATLEKKPSANQDASMGSMDTPGRPPQLDLLIKLAWSEYQNGKWTAQRWVDAPAVRMSLGMLEELFPEEHFYFRAYSPLQLFGGSPPQLVIECLRKAIDNEASPTLAMSRRLGQFVLSDCRGRWALQGPTSTMSLRVRQPGHATRDGMAIVQEGYRNDQRLHVLAGRLEPGTQKNLGEDGEQIAVLNATPGIFRILFPNSYEDFLSQDVFFYEDDRRSFLVTPKKEKVNRWVFKSEASLDMVPFLWDDDTFRLEEPEVGPLPQGEPGRGLEAAFSASSQSAQILRRWATSTPTVLHLPATTLKQRFKFEPFYHPYVCSFIKQTNRYGLEGLLDWSKQSSPLQLARKEDFAERYQPTDAVAMPYPLEDVDFSLTGAMSLYNWELFFHAPLLIADRLSKNLRFEEAQRWFHTIFDPTTGSTAPAPQRFWKVRPFFENVDLAAIDELLAGEVESLSLQIEAWRRDPFNPHHIARLRPLAYQKTVVMKYIDNLIRWADHLFQQDTVESTTQAMQLYLLAAEILGPRPQAIPKRAEAAPKTYRELEPLLDDMSNALVEVEGWAPPGTGSTGVGEDDQAEPFVMPSVLYFCIPPNDVLLGYWDRVADRLFKLRHCMNIEGVVRQLPLFEPPIDPALLVRAAAAGVDLSTVLQDLNAPAPLHRFQLLLQKANELVAEVKSLGQALLAAREKRDVEALSLLRSSHELRLLDAMRQVKQRQVAEAQESLLALRKAHEAATMRHQFHRDVARINTWENAHLTMSGAAAVSQAIVQATLSGTAGLYAVPTVTTGGAGAMASPVTVATTVDGDKLGNSSEAGAKAANIGVALLRDSAAMSATVGAYQRRWDDWKLQERVTGRELQQIDRQIAATEIRLAIVEKELDNHDIQAEQSREVADYLRDKFTNRELYDWMSSQLATLYFQSFQLAYALAKRAERAFWFERGLEPSGASSYIKFGHWDSLRRGLLAGEALGFDLKRLEMAHLEHDRRELELTKQISLLQHDPAALMELKTEGICTITLPEQLFDMDFPGHYLRRLKNISLTLPCIVGPYDSVNCTLTLESSKVRSVIGSVDADGYLAQNPDHVKDRYTPVTSIATSHAQNDSGLFEVNFRDERYLPFEGAGAVSKWRLDLPHDCQAFDVSSLSDVIIHVRYTARDGGDALAPAARGALGAWRKTTAHDPLAKLVSLRHDHPRAWQAFLDPAGPLQLEFGLDHEQFPHPLRGKTLSIHRVDLYRVLKPQKTATFSLELLLGGMPPGALELPAGGTGITMDTRGCSASVPSAWTLSALPLTQPATATSLADELQDVVVIVHYTAS
ncbi:neuraminidase-like domain-containing protein [Chondromyces apiculatus]|uniref:Virulence plasmid A protein n=1 Tax=Chondromyces apiculatus DSM 436 TaxID=1192034 RepID=A0A017SV76_9BACT|nr:neuraminidase-like domain-containing protein [Chondromyces apiculatus]EYF00196.1 Hypothetical protein CAP_1090 [Chondromyces apiculatus DSM 436]